MPDLEERSSDEEGVATPILSPENSQYPGTKKKNEYGDEIVKSELNLN